MYERINNLFMQRVEITINSEKETSFFLTLLNKFDFINSVRIAKKPDRKRPDAITLLSEKSLAEEWNSKEDERWDKIL